MRKSLIIAGIVALFLLVSVPFSINNTAFAQPQGCDPGQEILPDPSGDHHGPGFLEGLTDEQKEAVSEKIKEMRSQGASREEVHTAVAEMLKGYGIEVPADSVGPHGRGGFGPGPGGFWKDLTKEQREAVQAKIKEMKNQGSTRKEIHAAVAEMLKGYGIEVPEDSAGPHDPGCFGPGPGGFWEDLTKEQREAVREKIKKMRSQGATREEIHTAVAKILKGYGIEVPEKWDKGHRPNGWGVNLTDEQRVAIREKVREMRSQGAKRKEIRAAVAEMIRGFGIKSPGDSENVSSEKASGVPNIIAQSYPNPFNPETQIDYTLNTTGNVRIQIYNITGQLIRTFVMGYQPAGSYSVRWDGRNESGDQTASGVYLYRIEAGPYEVTNRMVLLK
jgi:DNA-binding transcriptional regulator YhcF (GntR family)